MYGCNKARLDDDFEAFCENQLLGNQESLPLMDLMCYSCVSVQGYSAALPTQLQWNYFVSPSSHTSRATVTVETWWTGLEQLVLFVTVTVVK